MEQVRLVTQIPCNSISKKRSEYLNVRVNYSYQGPAKTGRLGAVVTQQTIYSEFDEIGSTRKEFSVDLPDSPTGRTGLYSNITGLPLSGCSPKSGYGVKVYALDLDGKPEWGCKNILTITEEVALQTLEVDITPTEGGYVMTNPAPETGPTGNKWYNGSTGQFKEGTRVQVTAYPNTGYKFDHWSDEIEGGVSYANPAYVSGTMTSHKAVKAHFEKVVVEEYTLSVSVTPSGGGTVVKSPDKTKYTKGVTVWLTATPAYDYDFDRWSGDVTGYSTEVPVVMDKNKSVVANFKKKLPDPYTKVTFTVKGDGFPPLTSYWILYHYGVDGRLWQDYLMHGPGDIITVRDVTSQGSLSCFCCSSVTGEWSEQKYSREFIAENGKDYRYDIASGIIYYR